MPAFNIVRFKVKPGREQTFIQTHRELRPNFRGFLGGNLVRTGDQTFCLVGEWRNWNSLVAARPEMIGLLDRMRDMLEDLGGDMGVTDPVSGEGVLRLPAARSARKVSRPSSRKAKRPVQKKKKAKAGKSARKRRRA